jgi:hypothetical protein
VAGDGGIEVASQAAGVRARARQLRDGADDRRVGPVDRILTDADVRALEAHYTPRYDFQGTSDERELQAIRDRVPQMMPAN